MRISLLKSVPVVLFLCLSALTLLLTVDHVLDAVDGGLRSPSAGLSAGPSAVVERSLSSADDDLANYDNPSDSYSASMQVRYGHMLTGRDFEANRAYIERALYAPVVIFGLGALAIFFYLCGLLWRCCCECCRCLPDAEDAQYDYKRTTNTVCFYLFVLFVLLFDQLVFVGNTEIDKGVTTLHGSLDDIYALTFAVVSDAATLLATGTAMKTQYAALKTQLQSSSDPTCNAYANQLGSAQSSINSFTSTMTSLHKAVRGLPGSVQDVQDYLDQYAMQYRQIGIYVIWGLAIVCGLLFFAAKVVESMATMKAAVTLGVLTFVLYLLLGVPWVLIASLGGDFCMAPTYNLVKAAPGGDVRNMLRYYTSCVGNSTINGYIDDGADGIRSLNATLNSFRAAAPNCANVAEVGDLFASVRTVNVTIDSVLDTLDCANIRSIYFDVVNTGFCSQLYTGVFYIWGSQLVTSFCLFALLVVAVVTYQYFDVARVVPTTADEDDEDGGGGGDSRASPRGSPRMELVDLAEEHGLKPRAKDDGDHHSAQAYAAVGYFDTGLSPRS